jgi:hypothetical protein
MSKEFCSAIKGSGVGAIIGLSFGIATLTTIGFDRMSFFEGLLLVSCAVFGGLLFGSLIGVTGAFRKEELPAAASDFTLDSSHASAFGRSGR